MRGFFHLLLITAILSVQHRLDLYRRGPGRRKASEFSERRFPEPRGGLSSRLHHRTDEGLKMR